MARKVAGTTKICTEQYVTTVKCELTKEERERETENPSARSIGKDFSLAESSKCLVTIIVQIHCRGVVKDGFVTKFHYCYNI